MSSYPLRSRLRAAATASALIGVLVLLGGCSKQQPMDVATPSPDAATRALCEQAFGKLPQRVGRDTGLVNQSALIAFYGEGDARVVVRCGVDKPAELSNTSRCDEINGVGWFTQQPNGKDYVFTTIGRKAYLEVSVPAGRSPQGDVLNELTPVASALPQVAACQ